MALIDWTEEYKKKLVTADEAAKCVQSGDWIEYAFGMASSYAFDEALAKRAKNPPEASAVRRAQEMGVQLMDEGLYRRLQELEEQF